MSKVLAQLHADHTNLARLLEALERQLEIFDAGETPDYEIVDGIVDYCLSYPDRFHHPKEDAILAALEAETPDTVADLVGLRGEHEKLSHLTRQLAEVVRQILQDQEVPRDRLDDVARQFLELYRHHLEWEESEFLPRAMEALPAAAWEAIDARFRADDPMFGKTAEARFQRLRDDLLKLDEDDRRS